MKIIKRLLAVLLVLLIFIFSIYLARNIIATKILEKQLSISNGAKVDITGFDNRFLSADIYIEKIEIGNKNDFDKNIFELNQINFDINILPLLASKIIIDDMSIGLIKEGTQRKISGKLPENWIKKEKIKEQEAEENKLVDEVKVYVEGKIQEEKEKIALINLEGADNEDKVKEVVSLLELELEKEYVESKKYLEERSVYWQEKIGNNTYKSDLKEIELKVKNLDYDFEKIKEIRDIESLKKEKEVLEKKIEEIKKLLDESKIILSKIKEDKVEVENEIKNLNKVKSEFVEAANNDYDKLKDIISLDKETLVGLSMQLLGENVTKYLAYAYEQYEKITLLQKEEKIEGNEGGEVKKDKMPHLPKVWIKKISLALENDLGYFSGGIKNISTNQQLTKTPLEIWLSQDEVASINYIYDNREKQGESALVFFWDKIKLDSKYVKSESVRVEGEYNITRGRVVGENNITLRDFDLVEKEIFTKEKYQLVLEDLSKKIKEGKIETKIEFSEEKKHFSFWSNIDKELLSAVEDMLAREVEKLKVKVEERATKEIEKYKEKVAVEVKEKGEELGIVVDEELLIAIKNIENLESVEKLLKSQEEFAKKEVERLIYEKFLEEKSKLVEKLKVESEKIGIEILPSEYERFDNAKTIEEVESISKEVWKRVEEEKKKELEAKAKEEIDEEKKKLEEKAKEELDKLKDKYFDF